jgi:trans-aconitate methyltransferase
LTQNPLLRALLQLRGVHWVTTRFGPKRLRSLSFDEKYVSGSWSFNSDSPDLAQVVTKYSGGGHILVLGCGTCPIINDLAPSSYETLHGVDLSEEAISRARARATERTSFETGDMADYRCARKYDVILFSDSLNYLPRRSREHVLRRYRECLNQNGRIVVTIAQPQRYADILELLREKFSVDLDRALDGDERRVVVFR